MQLLVHGSRLKAQGLQAAIDISHHHHTVFEWQGFTVENHYDFINVHHHKSHVGLEQIFKELGENETNYVELNGEKVYLPSPNLHALFLIRHALNHFASIGIPNSEYHCGALDLSCGGRIGAGRGVCGVYEEVLSSA